MRKKYPITGGITFSAIGAYTENFISELIESGITVSNIHTENNIIYADARRIDYVKISEIAKKYRIKTKVCSRYGIYYKIKKARNRSGIIAGVFASAIAVIILQQFVWKIEIYGADKLSEELILETISNSGIKLCSLISDIDTKKAEIELKSTLRELSWVNIEQSGSRIDVYIREAQSVKKNKIPLNTPCNVIADKTGVIVETEVYAGTLVYPKGSGVSKGNVIVSGIVNDGSDNIMLSHANAKIIAEFIETVELRQDYKTIEKEKNGVVESEKELMIFGFVFPITEKIENIENKSCSEEIKNCRLLGFDLPWKIKTNKYFSYKDIIVTRSSEDTMKLLEQKLELYCDNFFEDYEVIEITKTIKSDAEGLTLMADVKLKGNIAVQQEIYDKF